MSVESCFAAALILIAAGGALAFCLSRYRKAAQAAGCVAVVAGCVTAGYAVIADSSADLFLQLPVVILGIVCGVFSPGYLKGHYESRTGVYWLFFNLTTAAMLAVTLADNVMLFLVCWEIMGLMSFALVAFDYKKGGIFKASWVYLLACEAGGLLLMALFFTSPDPVTGFILALAGFGLKIGFPLLHIWLPEAHPAAPAPVSALMSGAMIQLGFYGLFFWCGEFGVEINFTAAGYTFLGLGIAGSLGGILFALPQNNLKTLLAYSSIENMGIISLGAGIGLLGVAWENDVIYAAGIAGGSLHMLNHALLKGGLFLGAGAVQHSTGSLDIDRLGGLLKRMPGTGSCFLINATGISGIPPFNCFVSEFLIYFAAVSAIVSGRGDGISVGTAVLVSLALTGGVAGVVFGKAACAFLGEPRSREAAEAAEVCGSMRFAIYLLTFAGFLMTAAAPFIIGVFCKELLPEELFHGLRVIAMTSCFVWLLSGILIWFRSKIVEKIQPGKVSCTWDCGYAEPSARMEYTGSAFVQPVTEFLEKFYRPCRKLHLPAGLFPAEASYEAEVKDPALYGFWTKAGLLLYRITDKIRVLQSGYLHLYILIIMLVLIGMLIWALVLPWNGTLVG